MINFARPLDGGVQNLGRRRRLKPRRLGIFLVGRFFSGAAFGGGSALCGGRPEALPLDSATFEKVDETF